MPAAAMLRATTDMAVASMQRPRSRWRQGSTACRPATLQLLLLLGWVSAAAAAAGPPAIVAGNDGHGVDGLGACPGKPHCVQLLTDGTLADLPALFLRAITNSSINEIVLAGSRYVLRPSAWAQLSQQQPYVVDRNVTIRGASEEIWSVLDFQLIEKKLLLAAGVKVKFKSIVLQNIRKLGGFGLDIFMGEAGSVLELEDVLRVKIACQLPLEVLRSAQSFKRVSPAWPPNDVALLPRACVRAALTGPVPEPACYKDALFFGHFSALMSFNDPDKGSQYPGYVLYQENTTRVCQATVTPQCLADHNGDEELCMAMLVVGAAGGGGPGGAGAGGAVWTPGAAAGVAIGGAVFLLLGLLLVVLRRRLQRWCRCGPQRGSKDGWDDDPELGDVGHDGSFDGFSGGGLPSYTGGGRAISQQVTLGVLLGAGSFGRVYRGRWHGTDVAIKIISVRSPDELPKVLREAEVMMHISHPNVVRAFHASVWNPGERVRALQGLQEPRQSSSSTSNVLAAAPGHDASNRQRNAVRRDSSRLSRQSGQSGRVHAQLPAAAPLASVPAAGTSGQLVTPSISSEAPAGASRSAPQHAHLLSVSGTTLHSSSGNTATCRTGTMTDGGGSSAAVHASTDSSGWLPLIPPRGSGGSSHRASRQRQQQQAAAAARRTSADCTAAGVEDINVGGASGGGGDGTAAGGSSHHCSAAAGTWGGKEGGGAGGGGSLDVSALPRELPALPASHLVHGAASDPQLPASSSTQHAQLQAEGVLMRHLLAGWRVRRSSSGSQVAPAAASVAVAGGSAPSTAVGQHSGVVGTGPSPCTTTGAAAGSSSQEGPASAPLLPLAQRRSPGSMHSGSRSDDSSHDGGGEGSRHDDLQTEVWIILELCSGGTLMDAVTTGRLLTDGRVDMAKLLSRLMEAANGMAYLHSKSIVHGDLKAGNVLLQNTIHGLYGQVSKISDFGLSAMLLNGATHRSTASLGTITSMAPELLRDGRMSPAADVFSFGILMWEAYVGRQAWHGHHYGVVIEKVVLHQERPPQPPDMPAEYALLMRSCWDVDPTKRPSFQQVVECLELMLDNLASSEDDDDGGRQEQVEASGQQLSSAGRHTQTSGSRADSFSSAAVTPAAGNARLRLQLQPAQPALAQPPPPVQQQQPQQVVVVPAPAGALIGMGQTAGSSHGLPVTPMQIVQLARVPAFDTAGHSPPGSCLSTADGLHVLRPCSSNNSHRSSSQLAAAAQAIAPGSAGSDVAAAAAAAATAAGSACGGRGGSGDRGGVVTSASAGAASPASGLNVSRAPPVLDENAFLQDL